jgi:hypothetical protein
MEIVQFLVGVGLLAGSLGIGFVAGRDAAERKAAYTIANLRKSNRELTKEREWWG